MCWITCYVKKYTYKKIQHILKNITDYTKNKNKFKNIYKLSMYILTDKTFLVKYCTLHVYLE